jgi:hypothetical protein
MATYTSYRALMQRDEIERALSECAALDEDDPRYILFINFRLWVSRLRGVETKPHKKASARTRTTVDIFLNWWKVAGAALEARDYRTAWEALLDTPWGVINPLFVESCDATLRVITEAPKELQVDDTEAKAEGEAFLAAENA